MASPLRAVPTHPDAPSASLVDHEAERAVLGAVLLDPDLLPRVRSILGPMEAAFGDIDCAAVWEAMLAIADRGDHLDVVSVASECEARGCLRRLSGGRQFLGDLTNDLASTAHWEGYTRRVEERAHRRALVRIADDLRSAASAPNRTALATREQAVQALQALRIGTDVAARLGAECDGIIDHLISVADGTAPSLFLSTGIPEMDVALGGGVRRGELIVIAARPRVGKTTLVLQVCDAVARTAPVYLTSLEMTRRELAERRLASESGVAYGSILQANALTPQDIAVIIEARRRIDRVPLLVTDRRGRTVADLIEVCRRVQETVGLGLVAIDHLGRLEPRHRYTQRRDAIRSISGDLSTMARTLDVPVVVLAHLSREVTRGGTARRPLMEDLAESSAIEADADLILLMHREDLYRTDHTRSPRQGVIDFLVAKNRRGETAAKFRLKLDGAAQRLVSVEEDLT